MRTLTRLSALSGSRFMLLSSRPLLEAVCPPARARAQQRSLAGKPRWSVSSRLRTRRLSTGDSPALCTWDFGLMGVRARGGSAWRSPKADAASSSFSSLRLSFLTQAPWARQRQASSSGLRRQSSLRASRATGITATWSVLPTRVNPRPTASGPFMPTRPSPSSVRPPGRRFATVQRGGERH